MKILKIEEKPLRYLNTFRITYQDRFESQQTWEMVSRQGLERLEDEVFGRQSYSDGAMIVAFNHDRSQVVMIKEYRPIAGGYVYAFPAGLSDANESIETTAVREFKEETGLELHFLGVDGPRYTSVGLTNEKVHIVFGTFSGTISRDFLDGSEDIETVLVDRTEAKRLLQEEEVPIRTALLLRHLFQLPLFDEE